MKLSLIATLALGAHWSTLAASEDTISSLICQSAEATAFLGFTCGNAVSVPVSTSPATTSTEAPGTPATATPTSPATATSAPAIDRTATYALHALAIGDWGVDLGLGSCCNRYRQTGVDNEEYYKDQQAQQNVAHLMSLSAAKLKPKVVIGHGSVLTSYILCAC